MMDGWARISASTAPLLFLHSYGPINTYNINVFISTRNSALANIALSLNANSANIVYRNLGLNVMDKSVEWMPNPLPGLIIRRVQYALLQMVGMHSLSFTAPAISVAVSLWRVVTCVGKTKGNRDGHNARYQKSLIGKETLLQRLWWESRYSPLRLQFAWVCCNYAFLSSKAFPF